MGSLSDVQRGGSSAENGRWALGQGRCLVSSAPNLAMATMLEVRSPCGSPRPDFEHRRPCGMRSRGNARPSVRSADLRLTELPAPLVGHPIAIPMSYPRSRSAGASVGSAPVFFRRMSTQFDVHLWNYRRACCIVACRHYRRTPALILATEHLKNTPLETSTIFGFTAATEI